MSPTSHTDLTADTLLSTKLFVPRTHPAVISRPRLVARLVEGSSRRLTLVSAPPGAGKTTLISEWHASLQGRQFPLAWLTLDERDNDPRRFIAYIIASIRKVFPEQAADFDSLIQASSGVDIEHTLVLLLNLLNRLGDGFVLGIDDYQVIENISIHTAVDFLIVNAPASMRMIIASRTEPPLSLSRLRARNQLVEIRTADLRFTSEEVRALLSEVAGIEVAADEADMLASRTDGWAAGLQLAMLSLQGHGSVQDQLRDFGGYHRHVADYLIEEVVNRQPPEIRDFVTRISVLDRFSAELCDAVTGSDESAEHLRYLEQNNLFLVPLDGDRRWYRYHALFQELLQRQLDECCPEERMDILLRASRWFRDTGIDSEAVEYALRAGDLELAAEILNDDNAGARALDRGELDTVLRWLDALGPDIRFKHPKLNGVVIWSLISSGRINEIPPYVAEIERFGREMQLSEEDQCIVWGIVYAGQAALAVHNRDYAETIRLSHEALSRLPPDFPIARANTLYSRGFALGLTGDLAGSTAAFRQAVDTLGPNGSAPFLLLAHTAYAQALIHMADLSAAEETLRSLLAYVQNIGLSEWSYVGFVHICLARVLFERGEYDEALGEAEQGVRMATGWVSGTFELEGHFVVAAIQHATGNLEAARAELLDARKLVPMTGPNPVLTRLECLELLCDPAGADAARAWATEILASLPAEPEAVWPWLGTYRPAIQLAIQHGETGPACAAAETLLAWADAARWKLEAIHTRAAAACCRWLQGDREPALDIIRPAVRDACDAGIIQPFVETGPAMAGLLNALDLSNEETCWRDRVLQALPTAAAPPPACNGTAAASQSSLVEPLSSRELEVLEQIMLGKSNGQIAVDLFIAEGTVKRHTHNIYAKLGVTSRTQAIARTIELGLLDRVS